jgi:hypothetical protein
MAGLKRKIKGAAATSRSTSRAAGKVKPAKANVPMGAKMLQGIKSGVMQGEGVGMGIGWMKKFNAAEAKPRENAAPSVAPSLGGSVTGGSRRRNSRVTVPTAPTAPTAPITKTSPVSAAITSTKPIVQKPSTLTKPVEAAKAVAKPPVPKPTAVKATPIVKAPTSTAKKKTGTK